MNRTGPLTFFGDVSFLRYIIALLKWILALTTSLIYYQNLNNCEDGPIVINIYLLEHDWTTAVYG